VLSHEELARTWLHARGRRRLLLPVPLPGSLGRAFREGANLCPDQGSAGVTWREYLASGTGVAAQRQQAAIRFVTRTHLR
jgi:hypothetical protein